MKRLLNPGGTYDKKVRLAATQYVIYEGELYRKGYDGLLLRCISQEESLLMMAEVHEGICGAHQVGIKMRWLIRRHGHYWPTMFKTASTTQKVARPAKRMGQSSMLLL